MSRLHTKKIKDLQAVWYEKLKASGFEDIENTRIDGAPLVFYHSTRFITAYSPLFFTQRQEYYRMAGCFLYDHKFDSKEERSIWALHSDGLSIAKIKTQLGIKAHVVHKAIQRLAKIMLGGVR